MQRFFILIAAMYPFVFVFFWARTYDRHWEFGRYGMPRTLVSADGRHFKSGEPLGPITTALVKSGHEEDCYLGLVGIQAFGWMWLLHEMRKTKKLIVTLANQDLDVRLMRWK
ncbi:MAG TPA: hypothetical protein VG826_27185 [Pirellulales bacterium]|nr:hypothetical protein [Pirellulales bacterium]